MLYYKIKKETWNSLSERFRFMLEHQRKICVLSESYINTLKRIDSRLPANTVAIPNPNTFPDVKSIPQKEKILLFVGRLDNRSKKLFILIDIWRKIARRFADWKLIIVGSGRDEQNLYKYAKDVERIEFVNYCKPEPYYKQASIFCMTSLFEGFPMCLTEAMQYGCVPIAFNSFAAVNDIIKSGRNGELVTPFKTQEYIKKLSYLMENSNYRNTLSYNAFQYIKRYDVSAIIPQWIEMIES